MCNHIFCTSPFPRSAQCYSISVDLMFLPRTRRNEATLNFGIFCWQRPILLNIVDQFSRSLPKFGSTVRLLSPDSGAYPTRQAVGQGCIMSSLDIPWFTTLHRCES